MSDAFLYSEVRSAIRRVLLEAARSIEAVMESIDSLKQDEEISGQVEDYYGNDYTMTIKCVDPRRNAEAETEYRAVINDPKNFPELAETFRDEGDEAAFDEWASLSDWDNNHDPTYEVSYYKVDDSPDWKSTDWLDGERISYADLKLIFPNAGYKFGELWSPNEPNVEIYEFDTGREAPELVVRKAGRAWYWDGDSESWERGKPERLQQWARHTTETLGRRELYDLLDEMVSRAF